MLRKLLRNTCVAIGALVIGGAVLALANYAVTVGSGTNFGSIVVSTVHYAQQLFCDPTTPSQCVAVSAGGAAKVDGSAVTQPVSAASLPLPTGAATAAKQPALGTGTAPSFDVLSVSNIAGTATGIGWTTGTTGNSTQTLMGVGLGAPALLVQLVQGSTISGGAATFECTYDAVPNWVAMPSAQLLNPNTFAPVPAPAGVYTFVQSTNQPILVLSQGCQQIRIRLSTTITGSGTVTPYTTLLPYNPTIGALLNPLAAGTAVIGKTGIDPTTPGITNGVVNNPTSVSTSALIGVTCGSGVSSCVLKNAAGNFYGVYVEATSAGWLMVFNSASAPSNGATTAGTASGNMVECVDIAANSARSITYPVIPTPYSVGITAVFSSTACATLTLSSAAFIRGTVF